MLRYARTITIVDPYLAPDKRATEQFFTILMDILSARPFRFDETRVVVQVRDPSFVRNGESMSVEAATAVWKQFFRQLTDSNPGTSFSLRFWKNQRNRSSHWEDMHDRWLTTDFEAIMAPGGFDIMETSGWRRSAWGVLDDDAAEWLDQSFSKTGSTTDSSLLLAAEFCVPEPKQPQAAAPREVLPRLNHCPVRIFR